MGVAIQVTDLAIGPLAGPGETKGIAAHSEVRSVVAACLC